MDLNSQADNPVNARLVGQLNEGLARSGQTAGEYVKGTDWSTRVQENHSHLKAMQQNYDYIEDIYLITRDGTILYGVVDSDKLGLALFDGEAAQSRLTASVRYSLETGNAGFSDLEFSAPTDSLPTGYLTAPLKSATEDAIGIIAIQVQLDRIFQAATSGVDQDAKIHYLVGSDDLLRTPLTPGSTDEILKRHRKIDQLPGDAESSLHRHPELGAGLDW